MADAVVRAEVLRQDRGEKLISFKYRPKARRRVKKGHRQELTVLRITDVTLGGRSAAEDAKKAEDEAETERDPRLEEAAAAQAARCRARCEARGRRRRREGDDEGRREAEGGDEGQGRDRRDRD